MEAKRVFRNVIEKLFASVITVFANFKFKVGTDIALFLLTT